jgi:hypothetical protein
LPHESVQTDQTETFLLDNRMLHEIKEKCQNYRQWADLPWNGAPNSEC